MAKKKAQTNTEEKVLDVSASMQGTLRFDDPVNLRISGNFEGTLDTKGKLMVGEGADIKASLTGEDISIAGVIKGDIVATSSLSISSTAHVKGDIRTPALSVESGAVIDGNLVMSSSSSQASGESSDRGEWMSISELSKYLEVNDDKINAWVSSGVLPGTKEAGQWVFEKSRIDQWLTENEVKG